MTTFDLNRIQRNTGLRHVEYHETLDSTNRLASQLLSELLPLSPALVLTTNQTAGRGRGTHSWWANAGALTFSLVMNPVDLRLSPARMPLASLATGVAVRDVIASLVPRSRVSIKWPNDILVNGLKICGILAEQILADGQQGLIVGIGLNVNNSLNGAPDVIRQRATSIYDATGDSLDLTDVLVAVLNAVEASLRHLCEDPAVMLSELNRNSFLNGRTVTLQSGEMTWRGLCSGIDEHGALMLNTAAGPRALIAGTVVDW